MSDIIAKVTRLCQKKLWQIVLYLTCGLHLLHNLYSTETIPKYALSTFVCYYTQPEFHHAHSEFIYAALVFFFNIQDCLTTPFTAALLDS